MSSTYDPTVNIFRDKKTGKFLVQSLTEDRIVVPGTLVASGPPARFDEESMKKTGLAFVLASLRGDASQAETSAPTHSLAEQQRFMARNHLVSVTMRGHSKIELNPHERLEGYRGSLPEDTITISLPLDPEDFHIELMRAFDRCK